jgi:hypothetical protein
MPRLIAIGLIAVSAAFIPAMPAAAQDRDYRVNQLIIYGDDECPPSNGNEITVCARKAESERFRIPEELRMSEDVANKAWTERVVAYETVGNFGTNSCSPVGDGGWTGCSQKLINTAYAEKKQSSNIQFGQLIAEERAKRLSTVDQDSAEEQARVEVLEKDYEARQAAEQQAAQAQPTPGENQGQ